MTAESLPLNKDLAQPDNSNHTIIQLEEIGKFYGRDHTRVTALDNISLTIEKGEYCTIMGASGSGVAGRNSGIVPEARGELRRSARPCGTRKSALSFD